MSGLEANNFTILDNGVVQHFQLQADNPPPSIVIAVQCNAAVADYLPVIRRTGSLIESSLLGEGGRAALIEYSDDVKVLQSFTGGEIPLSKLDTNGRSSRMIDAGLQAVNLLKQEKPSRPRILIFIGQSQDGGSEAKLADLEDAANAEGITIHCLTLPVVGERFVAETFSIRGKNEDRGGFVASADLTKLIPALRNETRRASGEDAFSLLAASTGGTQIHFRKQRQLEDGLIAMGTAIRSSYLLTFSPEDPAYGYHRLSVTVNVPANRVYSRPGYRVESD